MKTDSRRQIKIIKNEDRDSRRSGKMKWKKAKALESGEEYMRIGKWNWVESKSLSFSLSVIYSIYR